MVQYLNQYANTQDRRNLHNEINSIITESRHLYQTLKSEIDRWEESDRGRIQEEITRLEALEKAASDYQKGGAWRCTELGGQLPAPKYPSRITSLQTAEKEGTVSLTRCQQGYSCLTGQEAPWPGNPNVRCIQMPVGSDQQAQGVLRYYPDQPAARSLENRLEIVLPGHGQHVAEQSFKTLEALGVCVTRPTLDDLEGQWLDKLAAYHGVHGAMMEAIEDDIADLPATQKKRQWLAAELKTKETQLDWESHCRMRNGELVWYRPGFPHKVKEMPESEFCLAHNLGYNSLRPERLEQVVTSIINNGMSLDSLVTRSIKGCEPTGSGYHSESFKNGTARYVYTRLQTFTPGGCSAGAERKLGMVFKPEVQGRLDARHYSDNQLIASLFGACPANERRVRKRPCERGALQTFASGQNAQVDFTSSLSLNDELHSLHIGDPAVRNNLLRAVKRRRDYWPDGRPVEEVFSHSWGTYYYELLSNLNIPASIKAIIRSASETQIQKLVEQNPDLSQGTLTSLRGIHISHVTINKLDFTECDMQCASFKNVIFKECTFDPDRLMNASEFSSLEFSLCSFMGQGLLPKALFENAEFILQERIPDSALHNNVSDQQKEGFFKLVLRSYCIPLEHKGCVPSNDVENVLKVLAKSDFFTLYHGRCNGKPVDAVTEWLSLYMDDIQALQPVEARLKTITACLSDLNFHFQNRPERFEVLIQNNPKMPWNLYKDLTSESSEAPKCVGQLIKAVDITQLQQLLSNNADLQKGVVCNLKGIRLSNMHIDHLDLHKCNMEGMILEDITLSDCHLDGVQLYKATLQGDVIFQACTFDNRLYYPTMKSARFTMGVTVCSKSTQRERTYINEFVSCITRSCGIVPGLGADSIKNKLQMWFKVIGESGILKWKIGMQFEAITQFAEKYLQDMAKIPEHEKDLKELVYYLCGIHCSDACAFIKNNPLLHRGVIDSLQTETACLYESIGNTPGTVRRQVSECVFIKWLTTYTAVENIKSDECTSDYKIRFHYLAQHYPTIASESAKEYVERVHSSRFCPSQYNSLYYDALVYLAEKHILKPEILCQHLETLKKPGDFDLESYDGHVKHFQSAFLQAFSLCPDSMEKMNLAKSLFVEKNLYVGSDVLEEAFRYLTKYGLYNEYADMFISMIAENLTNKDIWQA